MKTALLLMAHGSRQREANDDLHELAEQMRRLGRYTPVEAGFLELAEPTIATAARRCVLAGAERVIMLPYFLAAGVHVRQDLRADRERLAAEFPDVEFCLAEPLGGHPLLLEIVVQRAREAEP
jgi:sirohydrochlorin ferrochelatase